MPKSLNVVISESKIIRCCSKLSLRINYTINFKSQHRFLRRFGLVSSQIWLQLPIKLFPFRFQGSIKFLSSSLMFLPRFVFFIWTDKLHSLPRCECAQMTNVVFYSTLHDQV